MLNKIHFRPGLNSRDPSATMAEKLPRVSLNQTVCPGVSSLHTFTLAHCISCITKRRLFFLSPKRTEVGKFLDKISSEILAPKNLRLDKYHCVLITRQLS